jgi:hypothetical protein
MKETEKGTEGEKEEQRMIRVRERKKRINVKRRLK